jgi:hypothetical protein
MTKYTCIEAMYKFCATMAKVFGLTYLRAPNEANTIGSWKLVQREDFLGCFEASMACIVNARIVLSLDKGCIKVMLEHEVSYLNLW